ncbi:MAG: hypothetical protein RL033_2929 [Pseudomonadota bacterium]
MRRAFTPFAAGVLAVACQAPASAPAPQDRVAVGPRTEAFALKPSEAVPANSELGGELPERAGDFELDPYAPPVGYGEGGRESLDRACERVLGPGCRGDERAQLARVVRFHYVHRQDRESGVDGVLSRYRDELGAYARFTAMVLGEGDPAAVTAGATELDAGSLVLRADSAFAWRGRELLWLRQIDERVPEARREQSARAALPRVGRAILAHLGAPDTLPAVVQHLPAADRLPLGVRLLLDEAFGVPGLGPSAQGYYRSGNQRWRLAAVLRPDAESAQDVLKALEQQPDARRLESAPFEALLLSERSPLNEPARGWVITRRAEVVYGVAEEGPPGPGGGMNESGVELTVQDKLSKLQGARGR